MCEEYQGPLRKYKDLGMEQLHLPTTDHFEPTLEDLMVRAGRSSSHHAFRLLTVKAHPSCHPEWYCFHSETCGARA